ncbi:MAG: hypothetical protein M1829_004279 [Trizodia sp. TS-e1964]|nr:MAG: hypothetical protein M1829_004279 [Trizodia sp. TS-e1964]
MAAATQAFKTEPPPTPGFFAAAFGPGEGHNPFGSSLKDEHAAINMSSVPLDPLFPEVDGLQYFKGIDAPASESVGAGAYPQTFAYSPGVPPPACLRYGNQTSQGGPHKAHHLPSAAVYPQAWPAYERSEHLQAANMPMMHNHEPYSPQSAISPAPWNFNNYQQTVRMPLHQLATENLPTGTYTAYGQLTPQSDSAVLAQNLGNLGFTSPVKQDFEPPCLPEGNNNKRRKSRLSSELESSTSPESAAPAAKRGRNPTDRKESLTEEIDGTGLSTDEVKRSKFLERNRVAASKCRLKKKEWTMNLEDRAQSIQNQSIELHKIVDSLREEVLYLRDELLKHSNCDCQSIRKYLENEVSIIAGNRQRPHCVPVLEGRVEEVMRRGDLLLAPRKNSLEAPGTSLTASPSTPLEPCTSRVGAHVDVPASGNTF